MKNIMKFLFLFLAGVIYAVAAFAYTLESKHREFSRTKEKELRVIIDVSFGDISIKREANKIELQLLTTVKRKLLNTNYTSLMMSRTKPERYI